LTKFQGFILYGFDMQDLVSRIVSYAKGCERIVVDEVLDPYFRNACSEYRTVRIERVEDLEKCLRDLDEGYAIVIGVEPPIPNTYALAYIPVNKFNKRVCG